MTEISLKQRITDEMKAALRAGNKPRLGIIRLILAAIKQREVDDRFVGNETGRPQGALEGRTTEGAHHRISLDDVQVLSVLDKMVKQRRDSISQYQAAQRQDLADQEIYEISILQEFMPAALSEAEIDNLIAAAITSTGATSGKDMGKVIGALKSQLQGRADMGKVSAKIKTKLDA